MAKELEPKEVELVPDAWARFERAVDVVAKSPPQHRTKADVGCKRKKNSPRSGGVNLFFPKIISVRSDDAIRTRLV